MGHCYLMSNTTLGVVKPHAVKASDAAGVPPDPCMQTGRGWGDAM